MSSDKSESGAQREEDECPECDQQGSENPVLDDVYECHRCILAFNADGEVLERE